MSGLVLIAQADPFDLRLLEEVCDEGGFDVVTAVDGDSALNVVSRQRPALLVVDIELASEDGSPILEVILADPRLAAIPVLLTVGAGAEERGRIGLARGAADFVTRPYRVWEVEHRIRTLLRLAVAERAAGGSIPPSVGGVDTTTRAGDAGQMRMSLEYETTRALRYELPLTCVALRIANHEAVVTAGGDDGDVGLMMQLAANLRQSVRGIDHLFRAELDEFVILLPQTSREDAEVVLDRLRTESASLAGAGIQPPPELWLGVAGLHESGAKTGEALLRASRDDLRVLA
ncbi:MAG: response regulator [Sandaracinaceae bacterium]